MTRPWVEFTDNPAIDFMPDERDMEDKGGTLRLGIYPARLAPRSSQCRFEGGADAGPAVVVDCATI